MKNVSPAASLNAMGATRKLNAAVGVPPLLTRTRCGVPA